MNFTKHFCVKPGRNVRLAAWNPDNDAGCNKEKAHGALEQNTARLAELQQLLYAENRRALLIILQGMDASGKDGTIRHVLSGLNPQGCRVTSFKAPSAEEFDHDFLWRIHQAVPGKGDIGVFNRSHYEDVLIVRVHNLVPRSVWSQRYEQINRFEQHLAEAGTVILKFFLHISKDEQRDRLKARLHDPTKNWKFNPGDLDERKLWPAYQRAYEVALSRCSSAHAPWFIIPANKKWFRNLAISEIIVEALEALDMQFPKPKHDLSKIKVV